MSSQLDDYEAQAAIAALANELVPEMRNAIEAETKAVLTRIDRILAERRGEIDAASVRLAGALEAAGEEMKAKAAAALSEAIHSRLVPAIETEWKRMTEDAVGRLTLKIEENIQALTDARQALSGQLGTHAKDAWEKTSIGFANLTAAMDKSNGQAVEKLAKLAMDGDATKKELLQRGAETQAVVLQQSEKLAKVLAVEISKTGDQVKDSLTQIAERITSGVRNVSGEVAEFRREAEETFAAAAATHSEARGTILKVLEGSESRTYAEAERNTRMQWIILALSALSLIMTIIILMWRG